MNALPLVADPTIAAYTPMSPPVSSRGPPLVVQLIQIDIVSGEALIVFDPGTLVVDRYCVLVRVTATRLLLGRRSFRVR